MAKGDVLYRCDQCGRETRQKPGLEIWCNRTVGHQRPEYRRMKPVRTRTP
jgi:hypothetical protein